MQSQVEDRPPPDGRRGPAPLRGAIPRLRAAAHEMWYDDPDWITGSPRSDLPRTVLRNEVVIVFLLSLGANAVKAFIQLIGDLTAPGGLSRAVAQLNTSLAPGRPWLDLAFQLFYIFVPLVPVALAIHLLRRDHGNPTRLLGLDARQPGRDLGIGVTLALCIGVPGIGLYALGRQLDIGATVVPASLPHVWWAIPVLILSAIQNATLEEVIVVGYLLTRLRDLRWRTPAAIGLSAAIRGSYHLYQGFGAFAGNAAMGLIFATFYRRYGRVTPLIVAHSILDIVTFVGYALLRPYLHRWFPGLVP
ncbi:MAG TPA: type II CAAX endopeptidase family protein [Micromonosporaceae bacterium]|nr:type II CAAX endopeptidase family protein [Micromonosporaceae bacterium]